MRFTDKTQTMSQTLIAQMQLPADFIEIVQSIYLPLMSAILQKKSDRPLLISINGAQGTGKSTLTYFLKHLIEAESGYSTVEMSLDDFYLTRTERQQLSESVHPLLKTRGVPGTHDIELLENTITTLLDGQAGKIPRFNKAVDDRSPAEKWTTCHKSTDIILFEGWSNHSPVQTEQELATAINELEETEDKDAVWRHYANEQLKIYHSKIFNHADMTLMLKAPNFEKIYEWRSLQEEKLKQKTQSSDHSHVMSESQLQRFIQHYERITRHTLNHLPTLADIVIPIASDHSIEKIIYQHD